MADREGKTDAARGGARDAAHSGYALRRRRPWRPRPSVASRSLELRAVNEGLLIAGLREQELAVALVVDGAGTPVRANAAYAR